MGKFTEGRRSQRLGNYPGNALVLLKAEAKARGQQEGFSVGSF
ncbi:hypothetical protein [Almyronema epifaneia]|uniref:Uncharacterized protein n=1 Tax=Almyronema epifaneia S1 TaxID=2991925 RepID=A0ABW6I9U0_9CYAN